MSDNVKDCDSSFRNNSNSVTVLLCCACYTAHLSSHTRFARYTSPLGLEYCSLRSQQAYSLRSSHLGLRPRVLLATLAAGVLASLVKPRPSASGTARYARSRRTRFARHTSAFGLGYCSLRSQQAYSLRSSHLGLRPRILLAALAAGMPELSKNHANL